MSKSLKPVKPPIRGANDERNRYVARPLMKINPRREQFEPTPAEPVSQHKRMAGAC